MQTQSKSSDPQRRIKELSKDIKRAEKTGTPDEVTNLLHQRGALYRSTEEYAKALDDHKKEIRLSEKLRNRLQDKKGMAIAYHQLIHTLMDLRDGEQAMQYLNKYKDSAYNCGMPVERLKSYFLIGRVYLETGDKIIDNPYFFLKSERNRRLQMYEKAEQKFKQAEKFLQEFDVSNVKDFSVTKCGVHLHYGILKLRQEQYDESRKWIEIAIAEAQLGKFEGYLYQCHQILCFVYLNTKSYSKVISKSRKAFKIGQALQDPAKQIDSKTFEAKGHFMMDDMKGGLKALRKAYKIVVSAERAKYFIGTTDDAIMPIHLKNDIHTRCKAALSIIDNKRRLEDPDSDFKVGERRLICEKLGDNYESIENLSMAIKYYLEAIEMAEALESRISLRSKAALYASVAMTYRDNTDFDKAIEYFQKELEIRTVDQVHQISKNEAFKTRTQIACCKYRAREIGHSTKYSVEEIIAEHKNVLEKSVEASYPSAKLDALNNYAFCMEFYEQTEAHAATLEEKRKWLESINMSEEGVIAASEDAATPAPGNSVNDAVEFFEQLDNMSSSSDEEENDVGEQDSTQAETEFKVPALPGPSPRKRRFVDSESEEGNGVPVIVSTSSMAENGICEVLNESEQYDDTEPAEDFQTYGNDQSSEQEGREQFEQSKQDQHQFASNKSDHVSPGESRVTPVRRGSSPEDVISTTTCLNNRLDEDSGVQSVAQRTNSSPAVHVQCVHIKVKLKSNNDMSVLIPLKFDDLQRLNVGWLKEECSRRFSALRVIQQSLLYLTTEDNVVIWDEDSLEAVTRFNDMTVYAVSQNT